MSVTFETKVWENDWKLIMNTSRLQETINLCQYNFDARILYINNVSNRPLVENRAKTMIDDGILDKYVTVDEFSEAALDYFNLSKQGLGKGYYYSIAELVSIYLTDTKYLLHFSSDTTITPEVPKDWLKTGINVLETNHHVKVFNLTWNHDYEAAKKESEYEDSNCYFGYGFSDQMYLIRTADFKQRIYECYDKASDRYPKHGGESFEKKVDSWMQQNNFLRATYKHGSYAHKNFTKSKLLTNISIYFNRPNLFR
ncbi:MAG: hypothetical protein HKK67_06420 [Chlorobiaceae bacterium]|nr:hypothetical protein [Chlorobiaceae bacterium]